MAQSCLQNPICAQRDQNNSHYARSTTTLLLQNQQRERKCRASHSSLLRHDPVMGQGSLGHLEPRSAGPVPVLVPAPRCPLPTCELRIPPATTFLALDAKEEAPGHRHHKLKAGFGNPAVLCHRLPAPSHCSGDDTRGRLDSSWPYCIGSTVTDNRSQKLFCSSRASRCDTE